MFKLFQLFFCFLFVFNSCILEAKTLHAILVADTLHDICSITRPDLHHWQRELRAISAYTNMILKEKTFSDKEFSKDKMTKYLNELTIDQKDSIIFYFSGHGYRTKQKKTPWPFLTFEVSKPGLDVQWVTDTIQSKNPQFALVISDCCNNFMEDGLLGYEMKNIQVNLRNVRQDYHGYDHLFCKAKGCIVISSCSQGQFSYGSRFGGLYTQCFFVSLAHEALKEKPSWKNLLERANGYINHIQRPICEIKR